MYVQYLFIYDIYIVLHIYILYIYLSVASQINTSLRTLFIAKFVVQRERAVVASTIARAGMYNFSVSISNNYTRSNRFDSQLIISRSFSLVWFKFVRAIVRSNAAPRSTQSRATIFYYCDTTASYVILFSMLLSSLVLHVRVLSVRV